MWKTALLLILAIIVLPVVAFVSDEPPADLQKRTVTILLAVYAGTSLLCFIVSTLTRNYSQVDKLWSIMPVVYTWIIAAKSGMEPRLVLMAVLVTIWGIRLSFNFSRRGGYSLRFWSGREDYRWAILQARPEFRARWKWTLFNLFFISFYQMGLVMMITLPSLRAMNGKALAIGDWLIAALMMVFLIFETIADQQQWEYHKRKNKLREEGKPLPEEYRKGFVHKGLWALVRHPNYASEQAIWIVFYFFSAAATGRWLNWSVTGAVLLVLLFYGSSNFSESISAGKYPDYEAYRKRVPRFVPFVK